MDDQDRSVLKRFFIGLGIVVVIVVLVWVFFFRHTSPKNDKAETSKTNPSPTQTAEADAAKAANAKNTSNKTTNNPQVLADTGPGQTVAVFVLATIGGTLFHYYTKRRFQH